MRELLLKEKRKMALLKKYGYDIGKSRDFILAKAQLNRGSVLEIGTGKGHFAVKTYKGYCQTILVAEKGV